MRRRAITARIPEHEVALVERAAAVLGHTRSTFVRKAAVGVALHVARQVDPADAYARQGEAMALGLEAALAVVEGDCVSGTDGIRMRPLIEISDAGG